MVTEQHQSISSSSIATIERSLSSSFCSSSADSLEFSRRNLLPQDSLPDHDVLPQSHASSSRFSSLFASPIDEKLPLLRGHLLHRCLMTVTVHVGAVASIVVAGEYLYTGSQGNDIRMWRQLDLLQCGRFGRGEGSVKAILVAGGKVFSAHQDHKIRVWRRGLSVPTCHKHVATLPTMKDYLINCVSEKNYVQISRHHKKLWIQHADTISVLATGKSNKLLYSGSWDKTVKVWRLSDMKCLESICAHDDAVNALVVSRDDFIYTGSADGKVKVWTKKPKEKKHSLVATLECHKAGAVNALALSADGEELYSAGSDCGIVVWRREASEGEHMSLRCKLKGHSLPVLCLCTQGDLLLSGSADKTVRAWRRGLDGTISCVAVLEGHRGAVTSMCIAADLVGGSLVYSGSSDKSIKMWWLSAEMRESNVRPLTVQP